MTKLKIFFNENQVAKANSSFSPSAGKPAQALVSWLDKFGDKIEVTNCEKLTIMDLSLAHEKVYVEDVLSRKTPNGFSNTSKEIAESLPWNNGSFYSGAKYVAQNGGFAVSPTSGFHHACWNHGGGFCTFNGLAVSAIKLHAEGLANRIGILDCDQHYGNGTDNIINKLEIDYIEHWSYGYGDLGHNAVKFIEELPKILEKQYKNVDVLFYQAGADAHIDDPLGGVLNSEQMRQRDHIVFKFCKENNIPCVWNLAGGYQKAEDGSIRAVLDIHDATIEECLKFV